MKRHKKFEEYGDVLVRGITDKDTSRLSFVRQSLDNIMLYVKGMIQLIAEENSKGDDFDYSTFDRRSRGYMSRIETQAYLEYDKIAKGVKKTRREIFMFYREKLTALMKDQKFKTVKEDVNISFGGTANQAFTKQLRRQLQAGFEPASLIRTVSQEHVRLIQRELLTAVSKGRGFGWAKDRVVREMLTKEAEQAIRTQTEYNVTRIMRTSYLSAVNVDTTEFVFDNQEAFYGSRRLADGRPCIACIAQDGRFYKPGEIMVEHPNGMCVLVPLTYPDEFFDTGKITKPANDTFGKSLKQKFYESTQKEQSRMFGNKALYRLWKKERFDLDKMVVGKFGTPISYKQAALNLEKMGGISKPRVKFLNPQAKKNLNAVMDPKDRSMRGYTATREKVVGGKSSGVDWDGMGNDFLTSSFTNKTKAKIMSLYGESADLPWYAFNQRARVLNIFTRKDVTGKFYRMIPDTRLKEQLIKKKVVGVKKVVLPKNRIMSLQETVDLDSAIDLVNGKGLDKLRWSKEGQAIVNVDGTVIEGQILHITKAVNPAGKTFYRFEFKVVSKERSTVLKTLQSKKYLQDITTDMPYLAKDGTIKTFDIQVKGGVNHIFYKKGNITFFDVLQGNSYYGGKISAYTGKVTFTATPGQSLKESLKVFKNQLDEIDLGTVLEKVTLADRKMMARAKLNQADYYSAGEPSVDAIYGKQVDNYTALYKDLPENDLANIGHLTHYGRAEHFFDVVDSGKILSSEGRLSSGIMDWKAGESSAADMVSGGANGVFTRVVPNSYVQHSYNYESTTNVRYVINKKVLNRIDWYGFAEDSYGDVSIIGQEWGTRKEYLRERYLRPRSVDIENEQIFRHAISFEDVENVICGTFPVYNKVMTGFAQRGITKVNGKLLKDFVIKGWEQ